METNISTVVFDGENLSAILPMTRPMGKIRIKTRSFFGEYGMPFATRKNEINQNCYAEWQIGYDLPAKKENLEKTTLSNYTFQNYNNVTKFPYELSEILFYSHKLGFISEDDIQKAYNFIKNIPSKNLLDTIDYMRITRTNPIESKINDMDFYEMKVSYPLVVHKFGKYDIYAEIMNREKQIAVGVQPMLYICIPLTQLSFNKNPLGRKMESKECGRWIIKKDEAELSLELFKMFGMLSKKHQNDILSIMRNLFKIK